MRGIPWYDTKIKDAAQIYNINKILNIKEGETLAYHSPDASVLRYVGNNEPQKKYLEYVHVDDLDNLRGNYGAQYSNNSWSDLKSEIAKEGGLTDPIMLKVNRKNRTAEIGEGNHRITVAKEMGYKWLPVWVNLQDNIGSVSKHKRSDVIPSSDDSVFHPAYDADGNRRPQYLPGYGRPSRYLSGIRVKPESDVKDAKTQEKSVASVDSLKPTLKAATNNVSRDFALPKIGTFGTVTEATKMKHPGVYAAYSGGELQLDVANIQKLLDKRADTLKKEAEDKVSNIFRSLNESGKITTIYGLYSDLYSTHKLQLLAQMYHEMGHHLLKTRKLRSLIGEYQGTLKKPTSLNSKYSRKDSDEWFAENFSYWAMNNYHQEAPIGRPRDVLDNEFQLVLGRIKRKNLL